MRERPYELTSVFGIGFNIADTIARSVDIPADSPGRARAAVLHVLSEAERAGSTCLPVAELATRAGELLGTPPDAARFSEMADARALVIEVDEAEAPDAVWAYRPETAKLERDLAEIVTDLAAAPASLKPSKTPPADELVPAPEQAAAVRAAFTSRLSIVTGGPGTGKTATIRLICAAAAQQNASVLLVAPTGRAARRMSESSGLDASTVHAALGWIPGQGPTVEELDADVLIVDETSMANLELLVTLLRAVGAQTHVVLVGDADQLAPVGAGKPFAELVEARPVPIAELTHIFRQAAGSMIVRGAHAVRTGERTVLRPVGRDDPRPLHDRASRPPSRPRRGRHARHRAPPEALRRRLDHRHPGLRPRLPRRPRASTPSTPASASPSTRPAARSSAAASASETSSCSPAATSTTSAS